MAEPIDVAALNAEMAAQELAARQAYCADHQHSWGAPVTMPRPETGGTALHPCLNCGKVEGFVPSGGIGHD